MSGRLFYIVDAFAEEKYAGNQLAVVRDAEGLSDIEMQRIAREMNYSETTFVLSREEREGGYDVRIFTPISEVPFAGHPTLGTAYVIQKEMIGKYVEKVVLNLKVGQISVLFDSDAKDIGILWMRQKEPVFGGIIEPKMISQILSIEENDIDNKFPIQEVSTGLPFLIVPLRTLDAVRRVQIVKEKLFSLIKKLQAKMIFVFCPETYSEKNNLNARMFGDYYGVPEDPATGSANGCLAGYLVKYHYFGENNVNIRVEQGYEIKRPSLLYLRAQNKEGEIEIFVGGKVAMVAKGKLI